MKSRRKSIRGRAPEKAHGGRDGKPAQDLRMELNKERVHRRELNGKMKMQLKSPITQPENPKESLTNKMNHVEDRTWGLEDKGEDPLD